MADEDEDVNLEKKEAKPKRGICLACLGKIWNINTVRDENLDQELLVQKTFKELIIYLVFLSFVCIIAFGTASPNMYYYTKVMMDLFLDAETSDGVSFRSISSVDDFWKYAKGPLLDGLYWETWYNGDALPPGTMGYIYYENKLLGVPRLRQLRVSTNSCTVNEEFETFITDCYATYSIDDEDRAPFGRYSQEPNETAWVYQSQKDLEGVYHWGKLHMYGGGGYIKDLDALRTPSEDRIAYLESNLWIQRGARAVFISFTVYNANINLFCVITLVVEFPATGGAYPSWNFYTVKLLRYVSSFDNFIMACEIIFLVFIVYYFIEEFIEIAASGCVYFADFWNVLDLLLILFSIACIAYNIYRATTIKTRLSHLLDDPYKYAAFESLGFWEMRFNNAVAITVFFVWVKVFKYISFNKTMTQLSTTLSRCAKDLLGFFIMFFIVFLAFTQLGYLLFGTQVSDFSTFMNSFYDRHNHHPFPLCTSISTAVTDFIYLNKCHIRLPRDFTLFRIILGDFNFHQLEQANRILGPIFFMLFVFFVFFVLINMFLAIINDTYSEVKSDMSKQTDLFIMADYIKQGYNRFWSRLGMHRDRMEGYEKMLGSESRSRKIPFEEWKQELLKQGHTEEEIEEVFAKYDIDGNRILDPEEQDKMLKEFQKMKAEGEGKKRDETVFDDSQDEESDEEQAEGGKGSRPENIPADEFMALTRRVDRMEGTLRGVVESIDTVLQNIAHKKGG